MLFVGMRLIYMGVYDRSIQGYEICVVGAGDEVISESIMIMGLSPADGPLVDFFSFRASMCLPPPKYLVHAKL